MRNHTEPVFATPSTKEDLFNEVKPGAFRINDEGTYILCNCPCGCGSMMNLPIKQGEKVVGAWKWDGERIAPSLEPSIRDVNGCRFHGFLRAGVWTFTGDSGQGAEGA